MPPARAFLFRLTTLVVVLAALAVGSVRAQISADEQRKRELFLRARESIVPVPASTPPPVPAKPKPKPRPVQTPRPAPEREPEPPPQRRQNPPPPKREESPKLPRSIPVEREEEPIEKLPPPRDAEPARRPVPGEQEEKEPVEKLPPPREAEPTKEPAAEKEEVLPVPREQALQTPAPSPAPANEAPAAPITVEKSGIEEEQGLMPTPPPERRGLFGWGGPRYRYLTRGVRAAVDRAPVKRGRWQYIIVHNSGTRQGNARIFDNYHRNVRRMQNGLAYHFVIGNGSSSGDGEIEIGPRWTKQINGGHVASDYLNNISIGICLVGDYNRDLPTEAQLAALDELTRYLRSRVGKTKGRISIVKAHREINPKPTDCPGNRFPYRWLHRKFD